MIIQLQKNIKVIFESICDELLEHIISVIGVTTNNGANLVKCFDGIVKDVYENNSHFPIIRLACAVHTCQLIIKDIQNSNEKYNESIQIISIQIKWIRKKSVINM